MDVLFEESTDSTPQDPHEFGFVRVAATSGLGFVFSVAPSLGEVRVRPPCRDHRVCEDPVVDS